MKILIVTQYFYPENFKSNDLAFELKKRGHFVTVLTGLPNYPEGKVYKGYGIFKKRTQVINGVSVIRSLLFPRGNGGAIRLFLNYFSYAFFASIKALKLNVNNKYDAIIVHEPSPITQYYPAYLLNKLSGTPVYFWVMDLWPESLIVSGGIKNKILISFFKNMVIRFYKNSHKILVTSKGFKKSILEKGNFKEKLIFFPNWAEDKISQGNKKYPIPQLSAGFNIIFAGNVGESQDMESIMNAALILKKDKNIKFNIIGDGRKMNYVKDFIVKNSLENTVFILGKFPIEAMATFFDKADVLLVSLKDSSIFNLTVPAKIQAYMSSGKPILGMLNGEGAYNIKEAKCGYSVAAGNYKELSMKLIQMSNMNKFFLNELGNNGLNYYKENYKLESCISNLEKILNEKDNHNRK